MYQNRRSFLKASCAVSTIAVTNLAGCFGGGTQSTVNVGWVVPSENLASYLAIDSIREEVAEGAGNSYELQFTQIGSTPQIVSSIAAGEVDLGLVAYASFPRVLNKKAVPSGLTGISIDFNDANPDYYSFTIRVLDDSDVNSVGDLADKKIGVNAIGTGVQAIIYNRLEKAGLAPEEDVTWIELSFPAMGSGLEEGRIDAGIFPSTFAAAMRQQGNTRVLFDSRDSWDREYPFVFYAASNKTLENKTSALETYLKDQVALIDYMRDSSNRDTIISAVANHYNLPRDLLDSYLLTKQDIYRPPDGRIDVDSLQAVTDRLNELGFIDEPVPIDDHIDNSHLP